MIISPIVQVVAAGDLLTIGTLSARTGISIPTIRFYERKGLVSSQRTASGHRRFHRSAIRQLSVIVVCQRLGYPLSEIGDRLSELPNNRPPNDADWARLAEEFRLEIDDRVERLIGLRDNLDGCIGCGCVSLEVCMLYNPDDEAAALGSGPRYLLGDTSADLPTSSLDEHVGDSSSMEPQSQVWHLAQLNIGRLNYPVDDPRSAEFVENLDPINALAEASPGFIWRLQDDSGNATAIRGFDDPTILPNLSVWTSPEALKDYVFKSDHARFLRRRREWFQAMDDLPVLTMWWIPAGHIPTLAEARERAEYLAAKGPSEFAFSFRPLFEPPKSVAAAVLPEIPLSGHAAD